MIQSILNLILISSALSHVIDPQSDEFIDYINSKQNSWKAQKYNRTIDDFKKLLGSRKMNLHLKYKPTVHSKSIQIPESFDSRTNWPECKNEIGTIVDQSSCGSCWAVSAASVMSDRRCIASNGTLKVPVSAIDIITCCAQCGPGCQGGESDEAFRYWKLVGVVTGGDYNTNKGCKPYPFPTCEVNGVKGKYVPCTSVYYDIPICETKCTNNGLDYESDLTYGKSDVQWFNTVEDMQREILLNGPVVAGMLASDDFFHYKSGVYQQVGEGGAGHAVRIIGWGVDQASNLPYWLVANSWTDDWGENGYFRIIRGVNSCGIEDEVCASIPLV